MPPRDGRLEAGLVALPVDTQGLDVTGPVWTAEVAYASADPARVTGPVCGVAAEELRDS